MTLAKDKQHFDLKRVFALYFAVYAVLIIAFYLLAGDQLHFRRSRGEVTMPAHHTVMVPTGIAVALPEGTFGGVFARSGLARREGLRPANCVGVVDSDYRGECFIALHNDAEEPRTVRTGERIAQLVLLPYLPIEFDEVTDLPETARGEGGFGSTGR